MRPQSPFPSLSDCKINRVKIQSPLPHLKRTRKIASVFAIVIAIVSNFALQVADAQTTYTFTGGTNGAWLNATNWSGGVANKYPGADANASSTADGTTTDIAAIGAVGSTATATTIVINFGTSSSSGVTTATGANGSLSLGTIDYLATTNRPITVLNSSTTTDGTLTLNGNTLNTIANTIVSNEGSQSLTLANGTTNRMDVALGNTANNVVQVNGSGNITIKTVRRSSCQFYNGPRELPGERRTLRASCQTLMHVRRRSRPGSARRPDYHFSRKAGRSRRLKLSPRASPSTGLRHCAYSSEQITSNR